MRQARSSSVEFIGGVPRRESASRIGASNLAASPSAFKGSRNLFSPRLWLCFGIGIAVKKTLGGRTARLDAAGRSATERWRVNLMNIFLCCEAKFML